MLNIEIHCYEATLLCSLGGGFYITYVKSRYNIRLISIKALKHLIFLTLPALLDACLICVPKDNIVMMHTAARKIRSGVQHLGDGGG